MTILVTGSSGQLGRPVVAALRDAGAPVRGLTRSGGADTATADLTTGAGVDAAMDGVDTIVHAATGNGRGDLGMARNLVAAAERAGVSHLVLISIVGIDRIPLRFYRDRLTIERIVSDGAVPVTVQRATQFHSLIDRMFAVQKIPVVFTPRWRFQPIDVGEVGERLAQLALRDPVGRADDIGGPRAASLPDWYRVWRRIRGGHRPAVPFRLPGKLSAAYDAGANLVPGPPYGHHGFESYLHEKYRT